MIEMLPLGFLSFLTLLALAPFQQAQNPAASVVVLPASATIEIVLIDAPGINDESSRWEINYEFGTATDASLFEAHKRGIEDRVGDLIKQGSIKQSLKPSENRKVVLQFPLDSEMQERLKNQPPVPSDAAMRQMTAEQFRELEKRSQNFTFRGIVEIQDARLQRKIFVPLTGAWPYVTFPGARFTITIQIDMKGDYVVKYPRPPAGRRMEIQHP